MRIGITGAQSVGKTTLLNALRSEKLFKDYVVCDEVTRRVKSYGLPINEEGTDITQRLIMNEHIVNVYMHDNMLTDRTALDGLVYSTYLYKQNKISIAAAINESSIVSFNIEAPADTPSWDLNVLQGFVKNQLPFSVTNNSTTVIRVFFPSSGVVLNTLDIFKIN